MVVQIILLFLAVCLLGGFIVSLFTNSSTDLNIVLILFCLFLVLVLLYFNNTLTEDKDFSTETIQEYFISEIREIISDDTILVEVPKITKTKGITSFKIGDTIYNAKYIFKSSGLEISQIFSGDKIHYDLDMDYRWQGSQ